MIEQESGFDCLRDTVLPSTFFSFLLFISNDEKRNPRVANRANSLHIMHSKFHKKQPLYSYEGPINYLSWFM